MSVVPPMRNRMFFRSGKISTSPLLFGEDALNFAQGGARYDEFHVPGNALHSFAAHGKAVPVHRDHVQAAASSSNRHPVWMGLDSLSGNRKDGLCDHAFEHGLGKKKAGFARHLGQRGIFVRLSRNQVEHRAAAFDGGQQLVVGFG